MKQSLQEIIYDKIFKYIDNSMMESLLKNIFSIENASPEEKKFFNLLIESEKKTNFTRIKYLYLLEVVIGYGYIIDKAEGKQLLKIITAGLTVYNRRVFSKLIRKYEKKTMVNLEKNFFKTFNIKSEDVINKNVELVEGEELINIEHLYFDSYKNIATLYLLYTKLLQQFFSFINELIFLFLRPLLFESKYGFIRNTFNITFLSVYSICIYLFLFKPASETNDKVVPLFNINQTTITNDILTFFNNLNIIIEKDKIKEELSKLLENIIKVISEKKFINSHQLSKIHKPYEDVMITYKILETISSLIVNDAYLFTLTASLKGSILVLSDRIYLLKQKINSSKELINILNVKSFHVSNTIIWNQEDKYNDLFVLENVYVDYKENDIYFPVLININLNFEINKIHFIYGNSGSGKTTLLNTLMKKIKIKNGLIKFLNEYENYTYFSIRKYLTHLTSESILFSKSIYYNITFGMSKQVLNEKKDEILEEIIKYMNIFNMKSFIEDINKKNSKKLSKGQLQRIGIIRMFINIIFDNVKILFLDEFTSNIDNEMEKIVFNELLKLFLKYSLTIFIVSHNMYNIKYSHFNYKFNVDERSITKSITKNNDDISIK